MYHLLALTICLGLATCHESPRTIETLYQEGHEYLYEYETQILSGVPDGARTWTGLKLLSQIRIQMVSSMDFKMQFNMPRLFKFNDALDSRDPMREMLPIEMFHELTDEDAQRMKFDILKPVTFSYVRGNVQDLKTEGDDPYWSVNVKRGFLSMFEMNFNERQSLDKDVNVLSSNERPQFYRVFEPSPAGECQTMYRVHPETGPEDSPSMRVYKVRDFNRCTERVFFSENVLNGRPCFICNEYERREPFTAQSSLRYHVLGSPDQFLIVSAVCESQYNFVPYSEGRGRMSTFANQTLHLVSTRPISDQISDLKAPLTHDRPLKASHAEMEKSLLAPRQLELPSEESQEILKMVEKVLMGLENLLKNSVEEEMGDLLTELRRFLRWLDKKSLDHILNNILNGNKMPRARKVFWDLLPSIGTYPCVDVFFERVEKSEIPKEFLPAAFMSLSFLPHPDVFIVQRFMEFLKNSNVKSTITDNIFWRSAWLAFSSLGNRMIEHSNSSLKDLENEKTVLEKLRSESNVIDIRKKLDRRHMEITNKHTQMQGLYTNARKNIIEMVENLFKSTDEEYRFLALKVMGNLRYEEFVPIFEEVIRNNKFPERMRTEAVISLWPVVRNHPDMVERVYLPICFDVTQPDPIRIVAFNSVLFGIQSRSVIEMIVSSLETEPNANIGNFVYSALMEFSKVTTICDGMEFLAYNSTLARRFAWWPFDPLSRSRFMIRSGFDNNLNMGNTFMQGYVYAPEERFPTVLSMLNTVSMFGRSTDWFQMTFTGWGFNSVLDSLMEEPGFGSIETILKNLLHPRHRRSAPSPPSGEELLKEIKEKIGVKPADLRHPEGYFSFHMFGHELIFFDTATFFGVPPSQPVPASTRKQSILESLHGNLGILDTLKNMCNSQRSWLLPLLWTSMPTETGLPLTLFIDTQGAFRFDGNVNFVSDPRSSEKTSLISKMDAVFNMKPSAVMEFRGWMEVDMWHISSAVRARGMFYMNFPLSMTVNMDPDNSKILLKFDEQKETQTMRFESRMHTFIWRQPSSAENYPVAPEMQEITVVDGCDVTPFSFEFGKDIFTRSYNLQGEISVRRDRYVPFPPFSGRQVYYTKYDPMPNSAFEIHIQSIREPHYIEDETDSSEEGGSNWFPFGSWFSSSNVPTEEQKPVSEPEPLEHSSSESSEESEDPDMGFINLQERDLTFDFLRSKFEKETEFLQSGFKYGFVVRVVDSVPEPKHQVQWSALCQCDQPCEKRLFTMELRRMPKPNEEKPWTMITNMRFDVPHFELEPSDLLDNTYQRHVQDQIRLTINEDGQAVDSLLDLGTLLVNKAVKEIVRLQSSDSLDDTIERVIDHVMQTCEPDSEPLKHAVQLLRQVQKEALTLSRQPVHPHRIDRHLRTLKSLFEKSKVVVDKVKGMLDNTMKSKQRPEDSVQVLYIIISQEKTNSRLKKVVERMMPLLPLNEQKDLVMTLTTHRQNIELLKQKQRLLSLDKQPPEIQKTTLEVEPDNRQLYSTLHDIEKKLISLNEMKSQSRKTGKLLDNFEQCKELSDEIVSGCNGVRGMVDDAFLKEAKLSKMLRVKMLEVLLLQKQATLDIMHDIHLAEKKINQEKPDSFHGMKTDINEGKKKYLVSLHNKLRFIATGLVNRLAVAVDVDKQVVSVRADLSQMDQDRQNTLVRIKIQQLQILEKLSMSGPLYPHGTSIEEPTRETIQNSLDVLRQSCDKVKDIVDEEESGLTSGEKPLLCPVLVTGLNTLTKHLEIMHKLGGILEYRIIQGAAVSDPHTDAYKECKKTSQKLTEDILNVILRTEELLKKREPTPLTMTALPRVLHNKPGLLLQISTILKKAHKVESQHSELSTLLKRFEDLVKMPTPVDKTSKIIRTVEQKQMLYDIIGKLLAAQNELDYIQTPLKENPKIKPVDKKYLLRVVSEKQDRQLSIVRAVEKQLIDMSRLDVSLMKPLQEVQLIKDRVQRQQHEAKLLMIPVKNSPKVPERDSFPYSSDLDIPLDLDIPGFDDVMSDSSPDVLPPTQNNNLKGEMKITYGPENMNRRTMTIMMFARKSLEQLLWESEQYIPSKQHQMVVRYLGDRHLPNDPTAMDYIPLKNELNFFRHWHVLAAYEETLPMWFREWMWKFEEYLKLCLSDRVELYMPDKSNLKNNVEFAAEFRRDERWFDFEIKTPSETTLFRNMRTPPYFWSMYSRQTPPVSCEVTPYRLKTIPGFIIEVNLNSHPCESVLTMDCSAEPTFAVTSKPHPLLADRKVISIFTKEKTIEISPHSSAVELKVGGNVVDLPTIDMPVKVISMGVHPVVIRILRNNRVQVKILHLGLIVSTDCVKVSVEVPQKYLSRMCGVCGSYNGNSPNDLVGPQLTSFLEPQPFVSSYFIPNDQCDAETLQSHFRVPEIRKTSKTIRPIEATMIRTVVKNSREKTCFSRFPVKTCPHNSTPIGMEFHPMSFYCTWSSSSRTQKYLEIAKKRVVSEIKNKKVGFTENVPMPLQCIMN